MMERPNQKDWDTIRHQVLERDNYTCQRSRRMMNDG